MASTENSVGAEVSGRKIVFKWDEHQEMLLSTEPTTLFYARRDFPLTFTLLLTTAVALIYTVSRLQARIKPSVNAGLHLFWSCLVTSDVATCVTCFFVSLWTYVLDNGRPSTLVCSEVTPLHKHLQYLWLLLWVIFVVSVLRGTVAITWLHRIRCTERLADMSRGIGILCFSLLYLFPVALLSSLGERTNPQQELAYTVCVPEYDHGIDVTSLVMNVVVSWLVAILLSSLASGSDARSSLAVVLVVTTHSLPTLLLLIWLSQSLDMDRFRDCVPVIFAALTLTNALCNVLTYKLFPMATADAECSDATCQCAAKTQKCQKQLEGGQEKSCAMLLDPPKYQEKMHVI